MNEKVNESLTPFFLLLSLTLSLAISAPLPGAPFPQDSLASSHLCFESQPLTFYLLASLHPCSMWKTSVMHPYPNTPYGSDPHGHLPTAGDVRPTGCVTQGGTGLLAYAFILMCVCNNITNASDS